MNSAMAYEFLTRCFAESETIAILLRREEPARIVRRIIRREQATSPCYMRWLAHENASGMNVYVAANPLRARSRNRTKESIAAIRHLYLDIDLDGEARISAIRASDCIPKPTLTVATSPAKYQVLWRVAGLDFAQQETALKQLARVFGGDPACTDCNRVIRIPGFHNTKYKSRPLVTVEYGSEKALTIEDFRLPLEEWSAINPVRLQARSLHDKPSTLSERDWSWVLSELANGKDAAQLTLSLAERRRDKPNPIYYAQRTVDVAYARLALLAGTSTHDVIAALEARRSSDLPAVVCTARAREIAQTAAQMIARRKLA